MAELLKLSNLKTQFFTSDGIVQAVDDVSYTIDEGETVAIVGESGCGKSVHALSMLRLIPDPPGKVTGGEVNFMGQDIPALQILGWHPFHMIHHRGQLTVYLRLMGANVPSTYGPSGDEEFQPG